LIEQELALNLRPQRREWKQGSGNGNGNGIRSSQVYKGVVQHFQVAKVVVCTCKRPIKLRWER